MSTLASSWFNARALRPRRIDDAALGRQIGSALRANAIGDDARGIAGYRVEGAAEIERGIARFDATRETDGRWVTLEIPTPAACREPGFVARFANVALAEISLRHVNVPTLLDVGRLADGRPFRVREATDTESLAQTLAREAPLPWQRVRSISLQLCAAVVAARARGLRPLEISLAHCRRARHGRAVDEVKLGELTLVEPRRRDLADARALAKTIERLAAAGRDHAEATALPPELAEALAVPYRDVASLGRAIAAIGKRGVAVRPFADAAAPVRRRHGRLALGLLLAIAIAGAVAIAMLPELRTRVETAIDTALDAIERGFRGLDPGALA